MASEVLEQARDKLHEIDEDLRDVDLQSNVKGVVARYKNLIKSKMAQINRLLKDGNRKELVKVLDGLKSTRISDPNIKNNKDDVIAVNIERYKSIIEDILPRIKEHLPSSGGSRKAKRGRRSTRRCT